MIIIILLLLLLLLYIFWLYYIYMYGQCGIHPSRVYCKKWGCFEMGLPHYTSLHYNNYYQVNCSKSWWIYPLRLEIMEYGAVPVCKSPSKTGSQEKQQYTRNNIIKHYIYVLPVVSLTAVGFPGPEINHELWDPIGNAHLGLSQGNRNSLCLIMLLMKGLLPTPPDTFGCGNWVMQCMQIHIFFGWFSNFWWLEWFISTMFDD